MRIAKRTDIEIRDRQRKERSTKEIGDLKVSILSKGLMHPPVVWRDVATNTWVLIAGETRLLALDAIASEKLHFVCDTKVILPGEVPITELTDLTFADLFEAEFEENEFRRPLSWQDRALALSKLHSLRQGENPKQSFTETATALAEKAPSTKGNSVAHLRETIRESTVIAKHLTDPKISNARNHKEALQLILKKEGEALEAELIRRGEFKAKAEASALIEVRNGDSLLIMPQLEAERFDLILADPPYGIKNDGAGLRCRTVHHHDYEDTPDVARAILQAIIQEGFRVTKPRANMFVFGDIDLFPLFKTMAGQMGWVPFRTPITWRKSNEGLAPWGSAGFRRTKEWIFYATKGQRGLLQSPPDVLDFKRVARNEREYGAEKPLDLIRFLIEITTFPNEAVFDPCCGSGTTLAAARQLKRRALGIEKDLDAYNLAVVRANRDDEGEQLPLPEALA